MALFIPIILPVELFLICVSIYTTLILCGGILPVELIVTSEIRQVCNHPAFRLDTTLHTTRDRCFSIKPV